MIDEVEVNETVDTGDAFAAEPVENSAEAKPSAEQSVEAAAPGAGDAFSDDAEQGGDDNAGGSEQEAGGEVPEEYGEFTLPEGFQVNDEGMALFTDEVRGMGFNQDQAQKHLDSLLAWKAREEATVVGQMTEQAAAWSKSSKAAGLMTAESRSMASAGLKALDHDGSANAALKQYGLDRHPAVMAAFKAYGRSISDDQSVPGAGSDGGEMTKNAADILYPTQGQT